MPSSHLQTHLLLIMSLSERIREDIQAAQKDLRDEGKRRLGVLRMLSAALKNEEIALKARETGLTDEQVIAVVRREVKKRKDATALYRSHGEEERAKAEEGEAAVLISYLPAAPDEAQIRAAVAEIIAALPEAERNLGRVMKEAMARFKGTADGNAVRTLVQEQLAKH